MASSTDTVASFEALLKRVQSHAQSEDLTGMLLGEISTALADILACMERPEKADDGAEAAAIAKAVAVALAGLKFPAPVVNVAPPAITLQAPAARDQAAPNIVVNPVISSPAGAQWRIEIDRAPHSGRATGLTVTKL